MPYQFVATRTCVTLRCLQLLTPLSRPWPFSRFAIACQIKICHVWTQDRGYAGNHPRIRDIRQSLPIANGDVEGRAISSSLQPKDGLQQSSDAVPVLDDEWLLRLHAALLKQADSIGAPGRKAELQSKAQEALQNRDEASLRRLLGSHKSRNESDESSNTDEQNLGLLDIDYVLEHNELPSRTDYPEAPDSWFDWRMTKATISGICGKSLTTLSSDLEFQHHDSAALMRQNMTRFADATIKDIWVCFLKAEIPGVFVGESTGEGPSKQLAAQAAWMKVFSDMYVQGVLVQMLPGTFGAGSHDTAPIQSSQTLDTKVMKPKAKDATGGLDLSEIDEPTMQKERDAKLQIYNYAAGLGYVPQFEVEVIDKPRAWRRKGASKQAYKVRIKLAELDISVVAVSHDSLSAEVAAALKFKEEAQQRHAEKFSVPSGDQDDFGVLNIASARQFWNFYREEHEQPNLEMDIDEVSEGNQAQHRAQLRMNGRAVGQPIVMLAKGQAEDVAHLVAAVHTAKADPGLLTEFKQTLSASTQQKQVPEPLRPIDVPVDYSQIKLMSSALIAAYEEGLPEHSPSLKADSRSEGRNRVSRESTASDEIADQGLLRYQRSLESKAQYRAIREKSGALPIYTYRTPILDLIKNNQYNMISAATGSGKTTQIPQIIYENAVFEGSGSHCNIVCTQPRRIAAESVARRVAEERTEELRTTVGYHVRFDMQAPKNPYGITYCTNGILLRRLQHDMDGVLDTVSHLIIDEIHERSTEVDFLLAMLKRAIKKRKSVGKSAPKVILMSATLDATLFANYFGETNREGSIIPCPVLEIPGRTFPVRKHYLSVILQDIFATHGRDVSQIWDTDKHSRRFFEVETAFSRGNTDRIDWHRQDKGISKPDSEQDLIPIPLIALVIAHVVNTTSSGAILVFLPGISEIKAVLRLLKSQSILGCDLSDTSQFHINLLHSSIAKEDQADVFKELPWGCRRIILSTNIAETSITVPDVRHVIDIGKHKEKQYDPLTGVSHLKCIWESKSNLKQRAGRGGRVAPGNYYALFSKERAESFAEVGLPEMQRSDLAETCLAVKSLGLEDSVESFLAQAIEPPPKEAVDVAMQTLKSIEAVTLQEELTPLGRVLNNIPLHPSLGKMIVLGVVFRCLEPMIILGALISEESLFLDSVETRKEARKRHESFYGGQRQSDHIAQLEAFKDLRQIESQSGEQAMFRRAAENFLRVASYRSVLSTSKQIKDILVDCELIPRVTSNRTDKELYIAGEGLNVNSDNFALIKSLLFAGLKPNLAAKRIFRRDLFRTSSEHTVRIAGKSLNKEREGPAHPEGTLTTYTSLSYGSLSGSVMLRDTTIITPLMAMLFGGLLEITPRNNMILDDWVRFRIKWHDPRHASKLILEYRKALDRVLSLAFDNLSNLGEGDGASLAEDHVRERFVESMVELLSQQPKKDHALQEFDIRKVEVGD